MKHAIQHLIKHSAQVMEHYGYWPTFHDADYVAIHLEMDGPTVSISFRLYDWDDAVQRANRPSIILLWSNVQNLSLSGIEELGQNAVARMQIAQGQEGIITLIESTGSGTTMNFRAERVEVTHFDPHEEWDYEARNTASD
jgi:hypothetical protein